MVMGIEVSAKYDGGPNFIVMVLINQFASINISDKNMYTISSYSSISVPRTCKSFSQKNYSDCFSFNFNTLYVWYIEKLLIIICNNIIGSFIIFFVLFLATRHVLIVASLTSFLENCLALYLPIFNVKLSFLSQWFLQQQKKNTKIVKSNFQMSFIAVKEKKPFISLSKWFILLRNYSQLNEML